jgi:hypothetical protein
LAGLLTALARGLAHGAADNSGHVLAQAADAAFELAISASTFVAMAKTYHTGAG